MQQRSRAALPRDCPSPAAHAAAVKETVASKALVLGLQHYTRRDLEAVHVAGETLHIRVLGLVTVANDVSPEIALATTDSRRSRQW